jgi:hypothetical protein
MKYLLPCTCGKAIPVDIGQAGQRVACVCGKSVDVPTMRGIKELPPATAENAKEAAARPRAAAWSPLQGSIFSSGTLLIFIGLCVAAYFGYQASGIKIVEPTPAQLAADEEGFASLPIDVMYDSYTKVREMGVADRERPAYVQLKRYRERLVRYAMTGGIIAGAGALLAAGACLIRPGRK